MYRRVRVHTTLLRSPAALYFCIWNEIDVYLGPTPKETREQKEQSAEGATETMICVRRVLPASRQWLSARTRRFQRASDFSRNSSIKLR